MKKILIISHYYKHKNAMASVRAIKLAKYLDRQGYDVSVLASLQRDNWCKQELTPEPSETIHEYYAPEEKVIQRLNRLTAWIRERGIKRLKKQQVVPVTGKVKPEGKTSPPVPQKIRASIKRGMSWLFYFTLDRTENHALYKGFRRAIRELDLRDFDCVIATYPGAGAHRAGVWMKKTRRCKVWIADYRDPAYNPGARDNKIELFFDKRTQDSAVSASDGIVCVSQGMKAALIQQYGEKKPIAVITNGFDLEDYTTQEQVKMPRDALNFVYTGTLYHGRRTVDLLAKTLRSLMDKGILSKSQVVFHYAGPDFGELKSQLAGYDLEDTAKDYGFVSRSQSLAMQRAGDFVLLLNWNDQNYQGVIPGKIFEYMASGTPILALIMGNTGGSESANMIRENHLGYACEAAVKEDEAGLMAYMEEAIACFHTGKKQTTDLRFVSRYEYSQIAQQYAKYIEKLVKD